LRIIHVSDIHVWRYDFNPFHLLNKRVVGMAGLVVRRARKFRLERLHEVVEQIQRLEFDHLLITGDLTTTALPAEFFAARSALAPLLTDPKRVTILPGNHDRYTGVSVRSRLFERWFGDFAPAEHYPWLRLFDKDVAILGLDPTRAHVSASGWLPTQQLARARELLEDPEVRCRRLIVACHYPLAAPTTWEHELRSKRLTNAAELAHVLADLGPHLYCCGHVHAAWAFAPSDVPEQLCLNAGAPLLRDPIGHRPPGFLELTLVGPDVSVAHHYWDGESWSVRALHQAPAFFG
jgi:3',5'-cyclic AMP phosphodiesterase CpdA